jgi:hypothetical protein
MPETQAQRRTLTMKHQITDRAVMALLACYYGERPNTRATGVYGAAHNKAGRPFWIGQTNMGGAVYRMVEDLRERGFITSYNRYEDFGDKSSNDLTVLGYEALEERAKADKLPKITNAHGETLYDFNLAVSVVTLIERKEVRRKRETEQVCLRAEKQESERQLARERSARAREKQITKLRKLFGDYGLADNWSDDELLRFVDKVASC